MMYEILIKAIDSPTFKENPSEAYKKGDPVVCFPAGHKWGRLEGPPNFIIIKADLTEEEAKNLVLPKKDNETEKILAKRENYIDIDKFSSKQKSDIESKKIIEIPDLKDKIVISNIKVNIDKEKV